MRQSTALWAAAALLVAAVGAATGAAVQRSRRSIDLSVEPGRPQDARVPEGLVPTHYHLTLQPFLQEGRFQGRVRINVTCEAATRAVHVHAHESLHVAHDGVRVWRLDAPAPAPADVSSEEGDAADAEVRRTALQIASTKKDAIMQQYVIFLTQNLTEGEAYEVELAFSGPLVDGGTEGFFLNSYEDHRTKERRLFAATQMRQNNARRVFPCFDGPQYKATFDIEVVRPNRMAAISNMPLRATTRKSSEPAWETDIFHTTPLMSTFSLAIVVSDLGYITPLNPLSTEDGPRIRVFGRAHFLSRLQAAADAAPAALSFLQDYLGAGLPLQELSIFALPHFASRHPADAFGLLIFREEDLVGDSLQEQLTTELAYQWLGHLTSPAPRWAELQLNKALVHLLMVARMQTISHLFTPGNLATRDHSLYYEYSRIHPYAAVQSQRETIRLMKTQWVLRMLNATLTERTFRLGLQRLIQERQFATFEASDVWSAISQQAWHDGTLPNDVRLSDVVESWTQRDRFPMISVVRNYNDASAEVEQRVFIRERPQPSSDTDLLWFVPLPVLSQRDLDLSGVKTLGWLRQQRTTTLRDLPAGPDQFIIINPNEMGMFMVNYDLTNWQLLSEYLRVGAGREPSLDEGTRAKLLHDAWNLALAGELPFDAPLNLTRPLLNEHAFAVWDAFFTMVDHVGRRIAGTPAGDKFQEYVCELVEPLHERLSALERWEAAVRVGMKQEETTEGAAEEGEVASPAPEAPRDPHDRTDPKATLRALAKYVTCSSGCRTCREQAQNIFQRWMDMDDPEEGNPVADLYLCPVFAWGSADQWEFGLQRVINFPARRERDERSMLLAKVAGCARDPQRIERLLNASILEADNNFTTSDLRQIFNVLSSNAYGHASLFSFFSEHWDVIKEKCINEPGMWEYLVSRVITNFKTQEGLDLVSELYVSRMGQFGTAEGIVEEALRTIKEEAEWSNENLPDIERWLDARPAAPRGDDNK